MKKLIAKFLAAVYRIVVRFWHASYRWFPNKIKKVDAKVVSIGNITWGGNGKTPLTIRIARDLKEEGKKVAVLTRGYGMDEVRELEKKLPGIPVIVGRDRIKSAREAIQKHGAEYLILDDGFQHLRLHRNLDILTLNSTEPFGPGGLIPRGTLREPLENIARADVFVLSKANIGSKNLHWIRQKINSIKPNAIIFEALHKPVRFVDPLKNRTWSTAEVHGRKMAAISGIGDPHSFEKMVELLGAEILLAARYGDHHEYALSEIKHFIKQCRESNLRDVVTTDKDYFRLKPVIEKLGDEDLKAVTFWVLEIEFEVSDEEDFIRRCINS